MTPPATMDQLRDGSMNLPASTKCVIGTTLMVHSRSVAAIQRVLRMGSLVVAFGVASYEIVHCLKLDMSVRTTWTRGADDNSVDVRIDPRAAGVLRQAGATPARGVYPRTAIRPRA